jgi:N-acyl-L-homoserine lactone synthetase
MSAGSELGHFAVGRQAIGEQESRSDSAFSRNVSNLLEQVEYRHLDSGEDFEDVCRLRYNSYVKSGMMSPNASRAVKDKFDELPNSFVFGIYYEGQLVSTLRLHHVTERYPVSPSTDVFGDVLQSRISAGESFVDPSRFAADTEWSGTLRVLPYITLRLAVLACKHFNPTYCLTAVKEEHASFYKRIFRSEQATPPRTYPGLIVPVHLYQSKCSDNMEDTIERFPFFRSSASERRMLFVRPVRGVPAPLTILPTAKYLQRAA